MTTPAETYVVNAKVKTVVMTAIRAFRVDDYLTKPLDFTQLRDVLQKHLG